MSTKALVDRIKPFAKGWSRTGTRSILHLIQEGQDEMFDFDAPMMHYVSTDNKGFPPYLYTTAGTYRYNIEAVNLSCGALTRTIGGASVAVRCRYVNAIFVDTSEDYDYHRTWIGEPYAYGFDNPYRTSDNRTMFSKLPVRSEPAMETTVALVDFPEDPGTHTDVYFCDFVWEPPRLTAETVPLVIPQIYEAAIEEYAIGKIQWFSNGKMNEILQHFRQVWVPKFRLEVTRGAAATDNKTQLELC